MSRFHHLPIWKRVRKNFIRLQIETNQYICNQCGCDGRYIPLEVDHKIPRAKGGKPFDIKNLQLLCAGCHAEKSRKEALKYGMCEKRREWCKLLKSTD